MLQDLDALRRKTEIISGGTYALTLTTVDPTQVLYNGRFTYLASYLSPRAGGWCHLLVLRSKNNHSKQLLVIVTQTPDQGHAIVTVIEDIVTFAINFFCDFPPPLRRPGEDSDETITMTPENTTFLVYLPAGCYGPDLSHDYHECSILSVDWEEGPLGAISEHYRVVGPLDANRMLDAKRVWKHATLEEINDLIARL